MADTKPTKQETPRAAQAFADFVALGPSRSLRKLAARYAQQNVYKSSTAAMRSLSHWSVEYRWQARVAEAATAISARMLEEAAELDADTFLKTSQRLNELVAGPGFIDPANVTRIRESVRKPESKSTASIDVHHSGTIKHAHHDMSAFTDEEIDTLAAIAERHKAEASA